MKATEMSETDLHRFSGEHLTFELEHFFGAATELLLNGKSHPIGMQNLLISGFTMHARSILFFLYADENPKPDDALAQDFLRMGITWSNIRPPMPESLRQLQRRVGKEIVHLTYSRMDVSLDDKAWNLPQIIADFVPVFAKFTGNSDRVKLHENVINCGNKWMRILMEKSVIERVERIEN